MQDGSSRSSSQESTVFKQLPYLLSGEHVASLLGVDPELGLDERIVKERQAQYGPNALIGGGAVKWPKILLKQIVNAMMLVLLLALGVSLGIGSYIEGGVIGAVVALNIVVGFIQEFSAEKTMESLRGLSSPSANVIRGGHAKQIPSPELVPGDVVELKMGDTVPADLRIIEAMNFETDEALLTGESLPVAKSPDANLEADCPVGDRINMAFSSSTVTKGRSRGIIVATGMSTELGAIAKSLNSNPSKIRKVKKNDEGKAGPHRYVEAGVLTVSDSIGRFLGVNVGTPLQRKLSRLAVGLFIVAVIFALVVLAANKFNTQTEVIIYAVATGLSMIPASLIVVLTITMAVGTKQMVHRNVIVRKLDSLEALGAVTDICSDKTGTLTQGKMVVRRAWIIGHGTYSVGTGTEPFNPHVGSLSFLPKDPLALTEVDEKDVSPASTDRPPVLIDFLNVASLANLASVFQDRETGEWDARGDPTEIALQVFVMRLNHGRKQLESQGWKQLAEFPFDSELKRMSVIFENDGEKWIFMKGAVERVIEACPEYSGNEEKRRTLLKNMEVLASQGLRVLALGARKTTQVPLDRTTVEKNIYLLGLVGLYDPPRAESASAVAECHVAGINVHMLTGDHPATARAIAQQVGIIPKDIHRLAPDVVSAMVMTARAFDRLSDEEIDTLPVLPLVIARCSPGTKVRMIEALHRRKAFCAMTGDGVNDSPSLKRADVGIAMGMAGSDVAKDASDIVLTDDNFASIVNAIEEGRRMFDNIKKFVLHLLAENIAQACTLLIGLAFKDSTGISVFPLAPVEILWIIMVTSGFPAMGLGMEIAAPDIMNRPPHDLKMGVFTWEVMLDMTVYGFLAAALCLASFSLVVFGFGDGNLGVGCNDNISPQCETVFRARATTFTCLTWFALFLAWEMINLRRSFFRMQPGSKNYLTQWIRDVWRNKFLFWSIIGGFVTVFPIIYVPVINTVVFKLAPISWEWGIVFVETGVFFAGVEGWKFAKRIYYRRVGETARNPEEDLEKNVFSQYISVATATSETSKVELVGPGREK